jgi:hypothetical protein
MLIMPLGISSISTEDLLSSCNTVSFFCFSFLTRTLILVGGFREPYLYSFVYCGLLGILSEKDTLRRRISAESFSRLLGLCKADLDRDSVYPRLYQGGVSFMLANAYRTVSRMTWFFYHTIP